MSSSLKRSFSEKVKSTLSKTKLKKLTTQQQNDNNDAYTDLYSPVSIKPTESSSSRVRNESFSSVNSASVILNHQKTGSIHSIDSALSSIRELELQKMKTPNSIQDFALHSPEKENVELLPPIPNEITTIAPSTASKTDGYFSFDDINSMASSRLTGGTPKPYLAKIDTDVSSTSSSMPKTMESSISNIMEPTMNQDALSDAMAMSILEKIKNDDIALDLGSGSNNDWCIS